MEFNWFQWYSPLPGSEVLCYRVQMVRSIHVSLLFIFFCQLDISPFPIFEQQAHVMQFWMQRLL
jgi:hypothetical protein